MARVSQPARCPVKRLLQQPPSTSTHVESSRSKADIRYVLPANQPRHGTSITRPPPLVACSAPSIPGAKTKSVLLTWLKETVRINTANVAQPFIDADALSSVRP
ncbi:hypothetical protein E4U21_006032 [Claviceps maximensis]|nr:hypothetical protein E4U21_006032 [Claviceps maximensis]